jgi:alpha-aminoadipate carrier protein LysW
MSPAINVHCIECDAAIELTDAIVGEIIVCPDCGVDLEIMSLDPVQVDIAPMEQEDWGE